MNKCGIIGAGTMGSGICLVAARAGFDVSFYDISPEILRRGVARVIEEIDTGIAKGKIPPDDAADLRRRIHTASDLQELGDCPLIIEAIVEDLTAKNTLFRTLGTLCPPATILASNTSSLSITAIASAVRSPERIVGMHFFNPPHVMKLVEIVRGHRTSDATIRAGAELIRSFGKVGIIVRDTPGFIVNRTARPFYGEALRILGEGIASVEEIDMIVKNEGSFRMGPFELMDLIGIDVNFAVTQSIYEQTFGEPRYRPHPIQKMMVDAGLLGRKTKRGFYRYDE